MLLRDKNTVRMLQGRLYDSVEIRLAILQS